MTSTTAPALTVTLTSTLPESPTPKQLFKLAKAKIQKERSVKKRKEKAMLPRLLQHWFCKKMKKLVDEEKKEKLERKMKRQMEKAMEKMAIEGEQ